MTIALRLVYVALGFTVTLGMLAVAFLLHVEGP